MTDIKYRDGFPTIKCVKELISSFWGDYYYPPRISSYGFNGQLIWDRKGVNERIDDFCLFLNENGIEVMDYQLYDSPSVGRITLKKKELQNIIIK